jgi:hypothetical protein
MWPQELDSKALAAAYSVSNTPAYLFKRLRVEPVVERLAERYSALELVAMFNGIVERDERTFADVASAYGILVALGRRPFDERERAEGDMALDRLEWGRTFSDIVRAAASPASILVLDAPSNVMPITVTDAHTNNGSVAMRPSILITSN